MLLYVVFCCWARAPTIHAASHVDYENRVVWFSISMCARCSFPSVMGLRLAVLSAAGAPLKLNILSKQIQTKATKTVRMLGLTAL